MAERPKNEPPCPESIDALVAYIRDMEAWPEGASDPGEAYGRAAYAVAYASVATFSYMASALGITGFQASCADMAILGMTRGMKHGFMLLDAGNLLYPQYDLLARVREWIEETTPRLADAAAKLIREHEARERIALAEGEPLPPISPSVLARWRRIAAMTPAATAPGVPTLAEGPPPGGSGPPCP